MNAIQTSDDTRSRILREAERLFRHYGYSKTTVADIADACEMSSANVYRFFASKSQINEAICDRIISDVEAQIRKITLTDDTACIKLERFIELIARHTTETYTQEKKVHEMVVVAMEEHWDAIERHIQAVAAMVAQIIEDGIKSGEFKPQDPQRAARCVLFALVGFKHPVVVAQCCSDADRPSPQEMAAFLISALKA